MRYLPIKPNQKAITPQKYYFLRHNKKYRAIKAQQHAIAA